MRYIIIIPLLLLSTFISAQSNPFTHLKPAPTMEQCGCENYDAYKVTNKTTKKGTATVYKDLVVFSFDSSIKQFSLVERMFYESNGAIYKLHVIDNTSVGFSVKETSYIIHF